MYNATVLPNRNICFHQMKIGGKDKLNKYFKSCQRTVIQALKNLRFNNSSSQENEETIVPLNL